METQIKELKLKTVQLPVLSRLPNGCRVIVQDGYQKREGWAKYGVYSKNGRLITLTYRQSNKSDARRFALQFINEELRSTAMHITNPNQKDFDKVISKYR